MIYIVLLVCYNIGNLTMYTMQYAYLHIVQTSFLEVVVKKLTYKFTTFFIITMLFRIIFTFALANGWQLPPINFLMNFSTIHYRKSISLYLPETSSKDLIKYKRSFEK